MVQDSTAGRSQTREVKYEISTLRASGKGAEREGVCMPATGPHGEV